MTLRPAFPSAARLNKLMREKEPKLWAEIGNLLPSHACYWIGVKYGVSWAGDEHFSIVMNRLADAVEAA